MAPSIFTKIHQRSIPGLFVAENEHFFAILDINPITWGHVLVIPVSQVDYLFDLPSEQLAGLMTFSQRVAKAIEQVVSCKRIGVAVIGLEVPHAHIHLVPLNTMDDINFSLPKKQFEPVALESLRVAIAEAFI